MSDKKGAKVIEGEVLQPMDPQPGNGNGAALAIREDQPMVLDIARSLPQAAAQFEAIRKFMKSVMVESQQEDKEKGIEAKDGDYGTVPGIAKPFLFKSGAEKLATLFGYAPEYVTLEKIEDFGSANGFFFYRYRCDLKSKKTGATMGGGIGSCNSKEDRYRWTQTDRICTNCGKAAIIKGKKEYGGGWLCYVKKGGCGNKWPDGDRSIEGQSVERVEREAFSLVNTIDKMAQKRALVAATLIATGTSSLFTQDEDAVTEGENLGARKSNVATTATVVSGGEAKPAAAAETKAATEEWIEVPEFLKDANGNATVNPLWKELKGQKKEALLAKGFKYGRPIEGESSDGQKTKTFPLLQRVTKGAAVTAVVEDPKPATVVSEEKPSPLNGDKLDREIALTIKAKGWPPARVQLAAHKLGVANGDWTKADEPTKMRLLSALCDSDAVAAK